MLVLAELFDINTRLLLEKRKGGLFYFMCEKRLYTELNALYVVEGRIKIVSIDLAKLRKSTPITPKCSRPIICLWSLKYHKNIERHTADTIVS